MQNETTFSISIVGEVTGETFRGEFKAKKRLSHMDRLRKDQIRRDLLGNSPDQASVGASNLAIVLSELRVRLISAPGWWTNAQDGLLLEDENVLVATFDKVLEIEQQAKDELKKAAEQAAEELKENKPK